MDHRDPTTLEPATPDHVLAVLQDWHRQQCGFDPEVDPDAVLTRDTTVSEWRESCDLTDWLELRIALNDAFGLRGMRAEWKAVLMPASRRRLGELCDWIAARATRRIRPAGFLGASCLPAGAFLAVRSLLAEAGVDVREVAPSTPLADHARRHAHVFLGPISQLAPDALPQARIETPFLDAMNCGILASLRGLIIASIAKFPVLIIASGTMFAIFLALGSSIARWGRPSSVVFGDLKTFRDLAVALTSRA